ncbi:MAG: RDD family protein [Bryobacteraceae bacterium]
MTPWHSAQSAYPVAATAVARAYDYAPEPAAVDRAFVAQPPVPADRQETGQQPLFATQPAEPRVIPFESLTTQAERESIRARAAGLPRPEPVKAAKVELRRARTRQTRSENQRRLDFFGQQEVLSPPQSDIICDAPVAPPLLRLQAALVDGALMAIGCIAPLTIYWYRGGPLALNRHLLPFAALALLTIPLFYKLLWTIAGRDTIGMTSTGIELVDFDGNPPSAERRYQRLVGGWISLLAAGIGLIWSLVDQDSLAWHDHISGTFPTIRSDV